MGERRNDGGTPDRRRAHPDSTSQGHRTAGRDRPGSGSGATSASAPARHPVHDTVGPDTVGIEALLAEALVPDGVDPGSEQRAVAAFREARDADAHRTRTRTRRRDDWRPRERRPGRFSVKATLSVLVAGLSLGGVAVAGMGAAGTATDGSRDGEGRPAAPALTSAPAGDRPAGRPPAAGPDAGSGPAAPERPSRARDTEAHCRVYEKVEGRGRALGSAAWKRLVAAAGGVANVDAYCAAQVRSATSEAEPGGTGAPKGLTGDAGGAGSGPSNDAGNSGNGTGNGSSGDGADEAADEGADNGANGRRGTSGRPSGEKKP
ncbi:hypothetical protein [Streptomyces sp. NPDC058632]|uniref:hypothetical protein n=1 Tax=Streptomyces sp. NPDC058632 TaxID=3346567 RepID=UPI003665F489